MSVRLAYFDAVTDIEAEYYELREKMTRDDTLPDSQKLTLTNSMIRIKMLSSGWR